ERLVLASSQREAVVFDPFCGSGTVPVVCKRLGRNFIACDTNPTFVELASLRLAGKLLKVKVMEDKEMEDAQMEVQVQLGFW
ncbi:MAG TPA: DNA methyltransferase, partial [Acidobacteriota bacterium]|nr:DNA methyltransferase [Acidobacteriota bacterium]